MVLCRLEAVEDTTRRCLLDVTDPTQILQVFYNHTNHTLTPGELLKLKHKLFPELLVWYQDAWHRLLVLDSWTVQQGWSNIWTR